MNKQNIMQYIFTLFFAVLMMVPAGQAAERVTEGAHAGVLECHTVANSGYSLLIHSTSDITCEFKGSSGVVEKYRGETGIGLGVDLRLDRKTKIVYSVLAANYKAGSYQLAGKYFGGGGSATVGVGAGAQVLIGGGGKSISLQPLALSGSKGAGVTGGLTYLYLEKVK